MVPVKLNNNDVRRVALFGGTFDPIHLGHLIMAQMAAEKMKLDRVIFITSYEPPHKKARRLFSPQDRFKMVKLAVRSNPLFHASDVELKRRNKSFTIDTVRYFRDIFPNTIKLFFIIGTDAVHTLHQWKDIDDIKSCVDFICVDRPGFTQDKDQELYHSVTTQGMDISSTQIRQRILKGKPIQYLVPEAVLRYIEGLKVGE